MNTSAQARQSIPNQFAMLSAWSLVTMLGSAEIWVGWIYGIPHTACILLGHVVAAVAARMFLGRRAVYVYIGLLMSLAAWLYGVLPEFAGNIVGIATLILATVASVIVSERIPVTIYGFLILVLGTQSQMANATLAEDPTVWAKGAFYVAVIVHAMTAIVFAYYRRLQKKSASPPTLPVA